LQRDYDRTALLWAASELPGLLDAKRKRELIEMICRRQRPDGGCSIRTSALPEQWDNGNQAENLRSERSLRIPPAMDIVLGSPNSFGEQKRSMVNLTQVIKGLRASAAAHRKKLTVWRKRLLRSESWKGIRTASAKELGEEKAEAYCRCAEEDFANPEKHGGQNGASRRPLRPELKGSARMTAFFGSSGSQNPAVISPDYEKQADPVIETQLESLSEASPSAIMTARTVSG